MTLLGASSRTEGLGPTTLSGVDASLDAEVKRRSGRETTNSGRPFDGSGESSPQGPTQPSSALSRFSN